MSVRLLVNRLVGLSVGRLVECHNLLKVQKFSFSSEHLFSQGLSYTFHEDLYQDYELGPSNHVEGEAEEVEGMVSRAMPTFTSPSLQLTASRGNTVRLPCTVDQIQVFKCIASL